MAKYNGQDVTVTALSADNTKVTITFVDGGATQEVALGAIGELTAEDKLTLSQPEEPPEPPPIT